MAPTSGDKLMDGIIEFVVKQKSELDTKARVLEEKVKDLEAIINVVNAKLQGLMERKEDSKWHFPLYP